MSWPLTPATSLSSQFCPDSRASPEVSPGCLCFGLVCRDCGGHPGLRRGRVHYTARESSWGGGGGVALGSLSSWLPGQQQVGAVHPSEKLVTVTKHSLSLSCRTDTMLKAAISHCTHFFGCSSANIFSSSKNLLKTQYWSLCSEVGAGLRAGAATTRGDVRSGVALATWRGFLVLPRQLNKELQVSKI